jgi:CheY-like chemotaxis protein
MVLESAGYQVLQAADAATAIALAASHDGPIDLLITDVVMPDMDGRAAARAITEWRPGCRVLFISGYPPESEEFGGDIRITAFLQKPFVPRTLIQRVGELLNGPT